MPVPIADDFEFIRARLDELRAEPAVPKDFPRSGSLCPRCDGCGWVVEVYVGGQPVFEVCPACFNPEGLPGP